MRVVCEQFLGQHGLVTQHIDQEAQGAEIVAQLVKSPRCLRLINFHVVNENVLDALAHVSHSQLRLIQAQYREHAAHL